MDTLQIEQTAQHLAQLGCTAEQIERHLKPLRSAAARAAKTKQKPQQPAFNFTQLQIDAIVTKLKERQWRWSVWPGNCTTDNWVGHAILAVTGAPDLKSNWGHLVSDALTQLQKLGLIRKVSNGVVSTGRTYLVQVVDAQPPRLPRERLDHAERRERVVLSGCNGLGP